MISKESILDAITELEKERIEKHIYPSFVTVVSIIHRFGYYPKNELNSLYKDGRIEIHRTINDISIHVKVPSIHYDNEGT